MLYAPSHREYKNAKKKLLVWDVIGESLHMTVGVYFVAFVAVSTPTKATKDLAFPAVYCTPPLSMTLCGDYGNETRSSTHLYLLLISSQCSIERS